MRPRTAAETFGRKVRWKLDARGRAVRTEERDAAKARLARLMAACPLPGGRTIWDPDELQPDWCEPLERPDWVGAAEATRHRDDDAVVGIVRDGGAWALPWWVMKNHHVANLELAGRPWLVNFCEVCATAGLYDPDVAGQQLRWQVAMVWRGAPVLRDYQTGTLWQGLTMEPVLGPLTEAARPTRHPVIQCTWAEWRAIYPDSLVASGVGETRDGHGSRQPHPDHEARAFQEIKGRPDDDRLDQYALVLCLDTGAEQMTFPLEPLHAAGGVVTAQVGDAEVVATARPGSWVANVFSASVDGTPVALGWTPAGDLEDRRTATRWNAFGQHVSGPIARDLDFVRSGIEKWFAWSGIFPDVPIYEIE